MLNAKLSNEAVSAKLAALLALINNGWMDLYEGPQPDSVDDPPTGSTLLCSLQFGSPAYNAPVNGVADIAAPIGGVAVATGDASWLRITKADHVSALHDGSVGGAGSDTNLPMATATGNHIIATGVVTVDSYVLTEPKEAA